MFIPSRMDVDNQRQSSSSSEDEDEESESVELKAVNDHDGDDGRREGDTSNSDEDDDDMDEEEEHNNAEEESGDDDNENQDDEGVDSRKNSSDYEDNEEVSSMSEPEPQNKPSSAPPKKLIIKFDKKAIAIAKEQEEEADSSDSDDENVRKSRRSKDKPRKKYNLSEEEEGDDGFEDEESPKSKTRGRPKKITQLSSPEDSGKKKRGRPKKIVSENGGDTKGLKNKIRMKDDDIANALEESYQEKPKRNRKEVKYDSGEDAESEDDDGEDSEHESDDNSESDEQPSKKRKVEAEDDNTRRSGRERKVPKKFEATIPEKKKRKKKIVTSDFSENENSDSDYESKKRKRKKGKKLDKFNIYKKSPNKVKRKKKIVESENEGSDGSELSEGEAEYAKKYKTTMKKNIKHGGGQITAADYADKKSSRARTKTKYVEEAESHSSDVASDFDPKEVVEEEEIEGIQAILDYRKGKIGATGESTMIWTVKEHGDPNLTLEATDEEDQYWIKWQGWSHLNNTWESQATLDAKKKGNLEVKGLRKLINYQVKIADYNMWKRRANPEDVEYQEIDIEMGRQLLQSYTEVDRIFSHRKNENNANDYYVKWKNLSYAEATWEDESLIKTLYKEELDNYYARKKSKSNPRNYRDSMKVCKKTFRPMKEQPDYIGNETLRLRDYQLDGINFLLKAWSNGDSTILADEMGLGKTIQSITFLKYLFHNYPFKGPMLVCVPLSTMAAWQKEFLTWAPDINMVCYVGDSKSREIIRTHECENADGELIFNVLLTNYEMVCKDKTFFQDIVWSNIVVDEAHRLKNKESLLYNVLIAIESHHRLLLTGTPLQNSLKELWCLMNYLQLHNINIDSWDDFESNYGTQEDRASGYVKLHSLLKPYIIRRMKKDVEKSLPPKVEQILRVDMTVRQKKIYKLVLTKNFEALSKGKNQVSLLNIMMQLRKTCNHAELISVEEEEIAVNPEDRLKQLIYGSGKLLLLDKLLTRFREKGDRVLIFSQMVIMLNIMEEYMQLKRYPFQRLDGGVSGDKRKQSIAQFNDPNSPDFCFLLSTKAGGLGINLQTANRVIIFDSDWNPQNDLQAIARAHRIGQKEEVKIFRFVASSSVDEDIIHRAKNKMVLDHLVIQSMDTTGKTVITGKETKKGAAPFDKSELNMILKFGAEDLFKADEAEEQDKEVDLDAILDSAETREDEEAPQSEANKELLGAFKCTNIAFDEEEEDEEPEEVAPKDWSDIIPSAMVEQHKPKTGIDAYSDPEALFNPIAKRRKKRIFKKFKTSDQDDDDAPNSVPQSRDGSDFDGEKSDNQEDSADSDMTDGEREMMKTLKKRNKEVLEKRGSYAKKTVLCLKCKKCFVEKKGLRKHMKEVHKMTGFIFTPENALEAFPVNTDSPMDSGTEALREGTTESLVKKRRGPPAGNTRCFPCGKSFQNRVGYKAHIKNKHEGVEPQENLDPKNLALPDDRISCLICHKKFTSVLGLKCHIQRVHLGLTNEEAKIKNGDHEDMKEDEDEEDKQETPEDVKPEEKDPLNLENGNIEANETGTTENTQDTNNVNGVSEESKEKNVEAKDSKDSEDSKPNVSVEDARLIEKMYYMMRRYGCAYCTVRFNSKIKLAMHESIHAKDKKPVICPHCEKSYSRRDKLRKHVEKIHPGLPMPDPISPQVKKVKVEAPKPATNPAKQQKGKFKCPECDTIFSYQKGMVRHLKMFHVKDDKGDFTCPLCPLSYKDNKGLYQHMHRKHKDQKSTQAQQGAEATVDEPESDSDSSQPVSEQVGATSTTHQCQLCPKAYINAGSLWAHKKAKHPELSPKKEKHSELKISKVSRPANDASIKKDYNCQVCTKTYSNYMSLYMHKKTKHPEVPPGEGSAPTTPSKNGGGNVQVLVLGSGALTPTGRREKIHQCAQCPKKYADLKGLAGHIEKFHSQVEITPLVQNNVKEKGTAECPYCENSYSRRDKLYEHIRKTHPGEDVPKMERSPKAKTPTVLQDEIISLDDDNSNSSKQSNISSNPGGSGFGAGIIYISPAGRGNQGTQRGKYKQKEFTCHHCKKGYSDAARLKTHIESVHVKNNDPWKDVGPNTDIAIKNSLCKTGFEVYKVLGVYSTGLRFRAARFAPVDNNKWMLTEEINKNVTKQSILKILTTLKKDGVVYKIDSKELVSLMQVVSLEGGNHREESKVGTNEDKSLENEESQVEEENGHLHETELENGSIENGSENENGEVMVQPIFENGEVMVQPVFEEVYSEMDLEMDAE
eukprot:GFUD01006438.1.p1 GENE.GFUD01006438.1~~GFUD01006438.1.p1  ORF type:complete len:2243 (+),score=699.78 GFUD01006438.1:100-6828(+)